MKKTLALLLAVVMVFALCACGAKTEKTTAATEAAADLSREARLTDDIIVLYTNDVHCAADNGVGYSGLMEMKNALTAAGKTVLVVSSGDYIQGDLIGLMSDGEDIINIMNEVGYVAAALGNHEFDYGVDQLLKLKGEADFPMLCSNFLDEAGNRVFDAYRIVDVNGVKVAFIGITTPGTITSSTPKYFQDDDGNYIYSFASGDDVSGDYFCNYIQQIVDEVKEQGADYVIALSHLGVDATCEPYTSSTCIPKISGIDVYLDGHSHTVMEGEHVKDKDGKSVLVTQTGTRFKYLGVLDIKQNGTITSTLVNDEGVQDNIDAILKEIDDKTNEIVAHSDFDLVIMDPNNPDIRIIRNQETNLGNLVADAYREYGNADIAFANGGGIRAQIAGGDISYKNLISVLPFSSNIVVIKTSGQSILDALEFSVSGLPAEFGGFLQVSGLSFTVDVSVESPVSKDANGVMSVDATSDRRVKDVLVNGEPIDPNKDYTVSSIDYTLLQGGDGFSCFGDAEVVMDTQMPYLQVFVDYIKNDLGGVIPNEYADPFGDGRINIISG